MDKKVVILAALAAVGGIGLGILRAPKSEKPKAMDLFPPEKLQGYRAITSFQVKDRGPDGRSIVATATASFGMKPEEVSPTGYATLQALHFKNPKADWISVFIAEDSAMESASNWVGMAELRNGKITVTGGIPSQAEFDSLRRIGQPLKRPGQGDLAATAAVYDSTEGLANERWELSQNLLGAGSGLVDNSEFLNLDLETATLHSAAKAMGKEPKELETTLRDVTRFYWMKAGTPL
jgi:hypothetical protein